MKAVMVIWFLIVMGCTDMYDTKIPVANGKISDANEAWTAAIEKLPEAEAKDLAAYVFRVAMIEAMTKTPIQPVTIREALEAQKKFTEEQEVNARAEQLEAAEQARQIEQAAAVIKEKEDRLRSMVGATLLEKSFSPSNYGRGVMHDSLNFQFGFLNTSDKKITGMKGSMELFNTLGDRLSGLSISIEEEIESKGVHVWYGGFRFNQFKDDHIVLKSADAAKIKAVWLPEVIMFADGTVERL